MRRLKKGIIPLLLALLVLVPFGDLVWLPDDQVIAGRDLNHAFLPWWRFALDSLRGGELPLWNPYLFSGTPFLANPQPALFYPPVWLIGLLPLTQAVGMLLLFHLWLAGLGAYAWLRAEGADRGGGLLGAVVFAFSGYFSVHVFAGHIGVVMTQAWLSVILWAYRRAVARSSLPWAALGGVPVALSLLGGHTASFLYVGLVWGVYALYIGMRDSEFGKPLFLAGVMALVGLGLAAVQLLPTWEFVGHSTRQSADYAFASGYSWPPGYLVTLLIPNFFGEPLRAGYWGESVYEEFIFYVGVAPLLLTLLLGTGRKLGHRLVPWLAGLAVGGLLLALGQFGILHRIAYTFIPIFGSARAPARAGFLFTFSLAALAGLLFTRLRQKPAKGLSDLAKRIRGPLFWLIGGLVALLVLAGLVLFALGRDSHPQVGRLWHLANNAALFGFFFLLTAGVIWAWGSGRVPVGTRQGALLIVGLTLIDLWTFGRSVIQAAPVDESVYWREVAAAVDADEGRVLPWGLGIFEHNKGMALGLESVFGYDPLELTRYERLISSIPDPRARAYDLLNARYLVTGQEMDFPQAPESPRLVEERNGVWVYERPQALPQAWLVHQAEVLQGEAVLTRLNDPAFDPQSTALLEQAPGCGLAEPDGSETVRFSRPGNNRVEVEVSAASGGILVLSEVFYPGWQAQIDGESVPILRADYGLRAVCLPPGEHRVVMQFVPRSLQIGAGITLFSSFLMAWAVWRLFRRRVAPRRQERIDA